VLPVCALVLPRESEHSKREGGSGRGGGGWRERIHLKCLCSFPTPAPLPPYTCPPPFLSLSLSLAGHCNISIARRVHQTHVASQRHSTRLPSCAAAPGCAQRGKRRRAPVAVGGGRVCPAGVRQRAVFRGSKQGLGRAQRLVSVSTIHTHT
jgi:hypothetical protein